MVMTHDNEDTTVCTYTLCTHGHAQPENYTLNKSAKMGVNTNVHTCWYYSTCEDIMQIVCSKIFSISQEKVFFPSLVHLL